MADKANAYQQSSRTMTEIELADDRGLLTAYGEKEFRSATLAIGRVP